MDVFNFDKDTGAFIGTTKADKSPLDDEWLIPAFATKIPPPDAPDDQVAVFRRGEWSVLPDNLGQEYWLPDGSRHVVKAYGEFIPHDALFDKPDVRTPEEKVDDLIARVRNVADALRNAATGNASAAKIAGWNARPDRATRILGGVATQQDLQIIGAEAALKGRTVEQQAERIMDHATQFGLAIAAIDPMEDLLIAAAQSGKSETVTALIDCAEGEVRSLTRETVGAWLTAALSVFKSKLGV